MVLAEINLQGEHNVNAGDSLSALELCETAGRLQESGDYESARKALASLWSVIGEEPTLDGLSPHAQAEVFLRVGSLSGWLGESKNLQGAQEFAKNLLSRSTMLFNELGAPAKVAEANIELGICYWHAGELAEAHTMFADARRAARETKATEQEFRALIHLGIVDTLANRLHDALRAIQDAEILYDDVQQRPLLRGNFHSTRAMTLRRLYEAERLDDYNERAILEYTASAICFEECGHQRHVGRTENNLGFLLYKVGRYDEAMIHLDRARRAFSELKDTGLIAQVNETRARLLIAQKNYAEAARIVSGSALVFEQGDDNSLLAEALTTQAVAYARLGQTRSAQRSLERAAEAAETAGDTGRAGLAYLTMLEELSATLSNSERAVAYLRADELLGRSQDSELFSRLRRQVRELIVTFESAPAGSEKRLDDLLVGNGFEIEVLRYEAQLIRLALDEGKESVTAAARLLGVSHQRLCSMLDGRHQALNPARKPKQIRRKSIVKKWD
jgi:tetratricopeptide (TPR) repeat protein